MPVYLCTLSTSIITNFETLSTAYLSLYLWTLRTPLQFKHYQITSLIVESLRRPEYKANCERRCYDLALSTRWRSMWNPHIFSASKYSTHSINISRAAKTRNQQYHLHAVQRPATLELALICHLNLRTATSSLQQISKHTTWLIYCLSNFLNLKTAHNGQAQPNFAILEYLHTPVGWQFATVSLIAPRFRQLSACKYVSTWIPQEQVHYLPSTWVSKQTVIRKYVQKRCYMITCATRRVS